MYFTILTFCLFSFLEWKLNSYSLQKHVFHNRLSISNVCNSGFQKPLENLSYKKRIDTKQAGLILNCNTDSTSTALTPSKSTGKATWKVSSTNLLKNCVGSGVFSLNYRVTSVGNDISTFLLTGGLIFTIALWAIYNFFIIGETCRLTNSETFGDAWERSVSKNPRWLVQSILTIAPVVSSLANTIVLTDVLKVVLRCLRFPLFYYTNRKLVIATLATFILYPICTLKDLTALKSVSVIGLGGQLVAMLALLWRLLDGSYHPIHGRYYATSVISSAAPKVLMTKPLVTGSMQSVVTSPWFVLAALLSFCYVTHYNAPRYYTELKGKEEDRFLFLKMIATSYTTAAFVYLSTILLSIRLFGSKSASFALNSFSPKDPLATASLIAFGMSVLASYPLIFLSVRTWCITAFTNKTGRPAGIGPVTGLLLLLIGGLASIFQDIGKVGSLAGALFGSSMMFIFPPIMYIRTLLSNNKKHNIPLSWRQKLTVGLNGVLLLAGVFIGSCGTYNSLLAFLK